MTDNARIKTAIVTGGASGLGAVMAQHFASEGYHVALLDVNAEAGPSLAAALLPTTTTKKYGAAAAAAAPPPPTTPPRAVFRTCDVSSWADQADAFRAVYREFGRIDVVCANAGISEGGASALAHVDDTQDGEPAEPNLKVLDVNLAGVIYSVKLAVHYMSKNDPIDASRGNIICTASNAGLYAFPVSPLYAASKAGVIGLVRSTAPILERQKIRINALAPAVLVTNIAPDKSLFDNMIITPMQTLVDGVKRLIQDPEVNGEVAEIHGQSVTLRPVHDFVDEDSRKNLENFWKLGYA